MSVVCTLAMKKNPRGGGGGRGRGPITEVKHRQAGLVPGWVTTREHPMLPATRGAPGHKHDEGCETSGRQSVLVSPPKHFTIHQYNV